MRIECVWEHNGDDTLLYAVNFPGAYTRGENRQTAMQKMEAEIRSYLAWTGQAAPEDISVEIIEDAACTLDVCDADSDVLFTSEKAPLTYEEYSLLKELALKSAADFLALYEAIPDKGRSDVPVRRTFYGQVPRTAEEMYRHTKNVNGYYWSEIEAEADNEGTILECRRRGFDALETKPDFLENRVIEGSYGASWTVRKVLRRFLWHDRIHAKAMYKMAVRIFGAGTIPDIFCFRGNRDARALFELAMKYIYGDGVPENNKLATRLLIRAHDMGHVEATYNLGICYHYGYGTQMDLQKAYALYLEAANAGYGKGMELVGRFHNRGIFVEQDRRKAAYWLRKAMESSDPEAVAEAQKELGTE